jgi:hypothetical protein
LKTHCHDSPSWEVQQRGAQPALSRSGSKPNTVGRSSSSFLLLLVLESMEVFSRTRDENEEEMCFTSTLSCLSVLTHEFFERLAITPQLITYYCPYASIRRYFSRHRPHCRFPGLWRNRWDRRLDRESLLRRVFDFGDHLIHQEAQIDPSS